MTDLPTSAQRFIPQHYPMVLVDNILKCDKELIITDFKIKNDCLFLDDGKLVTAGIMENIAQTCAARIGFLNANLPARVGVIGAINNFILNDSPIVDEIIQTKVVDVADVFPARYVTAEVHCNNKIIASCSMKVFITEQ